ncbi:MAG: sortase [Chloroflexi bacterium]|nr:sortase [Chloroflexota bacterium]
MSPSSLPTPYGRQHRFQGKTILALTLGLMILWLVGCSGIHLAVVIGPSADDPTVTDAGEAVPALPDGAPTPEATVADEEPTAVPSTPTPEPTRPQPRIPAQSPPTRIVAPSIDLDAPVVTVGWSAQERDGRWFSEWQTASYAAGFHQDSALPGHVGNTVISGHHNIEGKVFEHLIALKPGDLVILYADDRPYQYRVVDKFLVKEAGAPLEQRRQNARWIAPTRDERLTLVTCWPPDGNTYRVIVIAKPVTE